MRAVGKQAGEEEWCPVGPLRSAVRWPEPGERGQGLLALRQGAVLRRIAVDYPKDVTLDGRLRRKDFAGSNEGMRPQDRWE